MARLVNGATDGAVVHREAERDHFRVSFPQAESLYLDAGAPVQPGNSDFPFRRVNLQPQTFNHYEPKI